jgi:hypothetical protein
MKTAILGWGSLLWDKRPEFDQCHGPWNCDGPVLPLEFSRISESRLRALTLVIDPAVGRPTPVYWCLSCRETSEASIEDLRRREGASTRFIGHAKVGAQVGGAEDATTKSIIEWARGKGLDAVVWTTLHSNFAELTGRSFSVQDALLHLKSLPTDGRAKAAEYIRNAPKSVQTPLRSAAQREAWLDVAE